MQCIGNKVKTQAQAPDTEKNAIFVCSCLNSFLGIANDLRPYKLTLSFL